MEITYRNEPQDIRLVYGTVSSFDRVFLRGGDLWIAAVLGMVPGAILLGWKERWSELSIGIVLAVILLALLAIFIRKISRKNFAEIPGHTLRLEPGWIDSKSERSWSRRRWQAILGVSQIPGGIVIYLDSVLFYVIPSRVFPCADEMERFASLAIQYFDQARQNNDSSPLTIPDWFQIPPIVSQVHYQSTEEEFRQGLLALNRPQTAGPAKPPPSKWIPGLIGMLAGIALLLLHRFTSPAVINNSFWTFAYLISCIAFWFLNLFIVMRLRARFVAEKKSALSPDEMSVTIAGCLLHSRERIAFFNWKEVAAIHETDTVIAFKLKPNLLHVVPKRAFASGEDAAGFTSLCHEFWSAATVDDGAAVPAMVVETGNPYQSPRH